MNIKSLLTAALGIILLFSLSGCSEKAQFLSLAESTVTGAIKGAPSAENGIDWNAFSWNNEDIGRTYMAITDPNEKGSYRRNIVSRLGRELSARGWNSETVQNWRVTAQGVESSIAVADVPGGTVTVFMQKAGGEKKIRRIEYK